MEKNSSAKLGERSVRVVNVNSWSTDKAGRVMGGKLVERPIIGATAAYRTMDTIEYRQPCASDQIISLRRISFPSDRGRDAFMITTYQSCIK